MNDFYVIGSINMDLIAHISHFPIAGETILGDSFSVLPGGKGANQAVSLARLGNKVTMFGAIGDDEWGNTYQTNFENEGVETKYIKRINNVSTGIALIELEKQGQNRIIVIPGANKYVDKNYIDSILSIICSNKKRSFVLLQLEIPLEVVSYVIVKLAEHSHITTILDPAPAQNLPQEIYAYVDYIIPNETETSTLTGLKISRDNTLEEFLHEAGKILLSKKCKHIIIKAGKLGAFYITEKKIIPVPPTHKVKVIDTTAAGDSFNAGFAHALQHNMSIEESIAFANKVAGIATTKYGAQSAMPSLGEVSKLL